MKRRKKRKDKNPIFWIGFSLLIIIIFIGKTYYQDTIKENNSKKPELSSGQLQKKGADVYLNYNKNVTVVDGSIRDALVSFAINPEKTVIEERKKKMVLNGTQDAEFITWTSYTRKYDLSKYAETGYTLKDYGEKIKENLESNNAQIDTFVFSSDDSNDYLTIKVSIDITIDGKNFNLHTHTIVLAMSNGGNSTSKPKLAIIIDDLGSSTSATKLIWELKRPVTVSILPFLPFSQKDAEEATGQGLEVLLHLPMEAINPKMNPGPGAITDRMAESEVENQVMKDLSAIPYAIGLNNHMGSKGTANRKLVDIICRVLKKQKMFFLDSHTTIDSKVVDAAKEIDLPYAQNQLFIDNDSDPEAIKKEIRQLVKICVKDGKAIGIGHVRENTLKTLKEMIPEIEEQGVQFTFVSELVSHN